MIEMFLAPVTLEEDAQMRAYIACRTAELKIEFSAIINDAHDLITVDETKSFTENIKVLHRQSIIDDGLNWFAAKHPTTKDGKKAYDLLTEDPDNMDATCIQMLAIAKREPTKVLISVLQNMDMKAKYFSVLAGEVLTRNEKEIQDLKTQYTKDQASAIHNDIVRREQIGQHDQKVQDSVQAMATWIHASQAQQRQLIEQHGYVNACHLLGQIGQATECPELTMMANVAMMSISVYQSIATYQAMSALAGPPMGLMLNPATAILGGGLMLMTMFNKKPMQDGSLSLVIGQLQKISEQIHALHVDMRRHFEVVFEMLDSVIQQLETHHNMLRSITLQINRLEQSLVGYNTVNTYFLNKGLLQDLKKSLSKVIQGNDLYFNKLGSNGFNKLFLNIFHWMRDYSFDPGCNGAIYVEHTPVEALKAPVEYRLGYLAGKLQIPGIDPSKMMIPDVFRDCVDGLELLVNRALHLYGDLPIDNFNEIVATIVATAQQTEAFIMAARAPEVLTQQVQKYREAVEVLRIALVHWIDANKKKYVVDVTESVDTLHAQMDYLNGHVPTIGNIEQIIKENPLLADIMKYASLLEKLKMGHYDLQSYCKVISGGYHNKHDSCTWSSSIPHTLLYFVHANDDKGKQLFGDWSRTESSLRIGSECTEETKIKLRQMALNRLKEIRATILTEDGVEVEQACCALQNQYMVIEALYKLQGMEIQLPSGDDVRKRLARFTIDGSEPILAHNVPQLEPNYAESPILATIVRPSINKLSGLLVRIQEIQRDYAKRQALLAQHEKEEARLAQERQKEREVQMQAQLNAELNQDVNALGYQTGQAFAKKEMVDLLRSRMNVAEADILDTELHYPDPGVVEITAHHSRQILFRSAFTLGASVAVSEAQDLLEEDHNETAKMIRKVGTAHIKQLQDPQKALLVSMKPRPL